MPNLEIGEMEVWVVTKHERFIGDDPVDVTVDSVWSTRAKAEVREKEIGSRFGLWAEISESFEVNE